MLGKNLIKIIQFVKLLRYEIEMKSFRKKKTEERKCFKIVMKIAIILVLNTEARAQRHARTEQSLDGVFVTCSCISVSVFFVLNKYVSLLPVNVVLGQISVNNKAQLFRCCAIWQ